jgi:broad-specificity NMP kinase
MTFPLFVVTGLSGSGKSTAAKEIVRRMRDFDVYDMDKIVVNQEFQIACNNWLKIAYSNALGGRGTILFGCVPHPYNVEICDHSHYFSPFYYFALYCSDNTRIQRLTARGGWTLAGIQHTNAASKELVFRARQAIPPIPALDTSSMPVAQVADQIEKWVLSKWPPA